MRAALGALRPARRRVPAEVRAAVDGRVRYAARARDGHWVAATADALHVLTDPPRTLAWHEVQRADWDGETGTLTVVPVEDFGTPVRPVTVGFEAPGPLLDWVRDRVTASVMVQRRVSLGPRRGLTVIGRRAPGSGGEITWAFELDPGVDPDDPAVRVAADQALRAAREAVGL